MIGEVTAMKGIGYARVSSVEQTQGTSLESQREQIRSYATMKRINVQDILIDAAVSGSIPLDRRPEGSRLVARLQAGEADCVILTKLDRGFRSASDCLNNVEAWEEQETSLVILNLGGQTIDTRSPSGKFFLTVMAAAAELERNLIRERCDEGRRARRAEGKRVGEVPFGFSLAPDGKTLVESRQEREAIALALQLRAEGYSAAGIARELNRRGIPTKKGRLWTHVQVTRLLQRAA